MCLALLAGCAVGPNYHPPKTSASAQWASPLADGETNSPAELAAWWKNFGDTNLDALDNDGGPIQSHSSYCRSARAGSPRRTGRGGRRFVAFARKFGLLFPQPLWRERLSTLAVRCSAGLQSLHRRFRCRLGTRYFRRQPAGRRSRQRQIGAAEYGRREVLVSLLAEVARNYIEARGCQQRLAITRQNIQVQQEILNLTSSRYQNGLSSDLDVQQATALLATTEARCLPRNRFQAICPSSRRAARPAAGRIAGRNVRRKTHPDHAAEVPAGLPSDLLQRRPDVQHVRTRTGRRHGAHWRGQGGFVSEIFTDGL